MSEDVADPVTRTIRVLAEQCATCVFRPGNLMHLAPGRLKQLVDETCANEGHVVCHDTLSSSGYDVAPAICRGFANSPHAARSMALRVGAVMDCLVEVEPPN